MSIFVVLDKRYTGAGNGYVGEYEGAKVSHTMFNDTINQVHYQVEEGKYSRGYYIDTLISVQYDFSYTPPTNPYKQVKENELNDIQEAFDAFAIGFAAENSEMLNTEVARKVGLWMVDNLDPDGLDPADTVALAVFIQSKLNPLVDALKPLFEDIKMNYFWRVEQHIAAVPREDLLASEARLTQYLADLIAIVRPT